MKRYLISATSAIFLFAGIAANEAEAQSNRYFSGDDRPEAYIISARQLQRGEKAFGLHHSWVTNSALASPPNFAAFWMKWATGDRFQLGVNGSTSYGLRAATGGLLSTDGVGQLGLEGKYHVGSYGDWNVAVLGAIEYINWQERIPVGGSFMTASPAGSIHLPVTYAPSETFALSASLSYALLPEFSLSGAGVGKIAAVGGGVKFDPAGPLRFFASVHVPVSGENRLLPSGTLDSVPVWAIGGSADVGNGWAIDLSASNSDISSPTTQLLTSLSDDVFLVSFGVSKKIGK